MSASSIHSIELLEILWSGSDRVTGMEMKAMNRSKKPDLDLAFGKKEEVEDIR